LAGSREAINFMRYFARPYFFTAAISPLVAASVLAGLKKIKADPTPSRQVLQNARLFKEKLRAAKILFADHESAIVPVFPPGETNFRELSLKVHENDLFINAIEPPAVPEGSERFRVSLMATHTAEHIDAAVSILKRVYARYSQ
jgi:glycine C-acetyltransferase